MAELLKREHRLMSLRVELEGWSGEPHVVLGFEAGGGLQRTWNLPMATLGLDRETEQAVGHTPRLPVEVLDEIAGLARVCAKAGPDEPMWLHLVRPYGRLGVAPWEMVLGEAVERPILRLPDFLERSKEDPGVLEIAICFDPPWKSDLRVACERVADVISSALESPRLRIVVHLFTTPEAADVLEGRTDPRLRIHDANALAAGSDVTASVADRSSPWLDWMGDVLRGRTLDAVHFVCSTETTDERATLLLRSSPRPEKFQALSAVNAAEVTNFLQRTGAWVALFSPPPTSGTEGPCRYFADALAQIRPGPVVYHEFSDNQSARSQLDKIYRFLFAPEPAPAPVLRKDFLYCQPALVSSYEDWDHQQSWELGPPRIRYPSYASSARAKASGRSGSNPDYPLPEASAWTAAAQRFVEKASLDAARLRQSATGPFLTEAVRETALSANAVVQDTLGEIQKIIDRHAAARRGED